MRIIPTLLLATALTQPSWAQDTNRLLRFPDVHQSKVAFVYGGNIYVATLGEGAQSVTAQRLTSHAGDELFPKFSPDGSQIAFSAEYSGTRQVYVMPATGGEVKQLTYYNDVGSLPPRGGYDYRVLDFSPDGEHVLFRANRLPWSPRMGRLFQIAVDGGMEAPLEIPESGGGMFAPDGKRVVYTPIDREFRTWKRYRGGRAQDVWIYDLENHSAERLTEHPGTDNQPVIVDEDIYFTSDRDYTLNLYRYRRDAEPEKVTDHSDFDVLWPSAGPNAIVYESGGHLYRFDPAARDSQRLAIEVRDDRPATRPRFVEVKDQIESMDLSSDGKHAAFGARGEVFVVDVETPELARNVTNTPRAREHSVSWSPSGTWLAYLSDATGEYEIYVRRADGQGEARRVTDDGDIWRFGPLWSPDGRRFAYGDMRQRLRVVEVSSGRTVDVDTSTRNSFTDYEWSPDSRWLAYSKVSGSRLSALWVYSLDRGERYRLTNGDSDAYAPAFDPKGRYLYFISNRDFNLKFSSYEFNYVYADSARVYAGLLNADSPALYRPKITAVDGDNGNGAKDEDDDKDEEKPPRIRIDVEGFNDRIHAVTKKGGNVGGLLATNNGVFYVKRRDNGNGATLRYFDVEKEKDSAVLRQVQGYAISADGKRLLYARTNDRYGVVDAKPGQNDEAKDLDLSRLQVRLDPRVEWQQLYVDGWRILRDWFYDPGLHGMDWEAIRAKYEALLPSVSTRSDLDYIFSEMAGELNAGHVYVQSGDSEGPERVAGGLLGATFSHDDSGYFRFDTIMRGASWSSDLRSPLAEPGVNVQEGEYLLAVNGRSATDVVNVYELLENTADKLTRLTVNDRPSPQGARDEWVKPVDSELSLRYLAWVNERRAMVDRLSNGRIGYIHVPNTSVDGNRELFRGFLAQTEKDALIIDDRYNGGGFIPDRMIEWLDRKTLNYWKTRGQEPAPTPLFAHDGPKAMLINGYSASGGDALPYYFRQASLGPLIGTRTWGGLIGISGNPSLADGGAILAATFRFMDTDGKWAVENEGVAPDIEVIDAPDAVAAGRDPSLERAVDYLLEQLANKPPAGVKAPPAPTEFK